MKSNASVDIARDPETVFKFAIEHVPEWSSVVVSDELVNDVNNNSPGTTFKVVTEDKGKRMEFDGEVLVNDPPSKHRSIMKGEYFDMDVTYLFEEVNGKTRVSQEADVQPKGFLKVVFFLIGWMMKNGGCRAAQNELENLKRILEETEA